ncbi:MAG: response regulator transcription factor [Chitinophagaceae bacterium]|jgi:DNA-binding NarL/FixJ family response regulator
MSPIQYIITDDHKIFRQGLRLALNNYPDLEFAGEAANGFELLSLLATKKPDVILLDLKMPEMDGRQVLKEIKSKYPEIKILILTMFEEEHFILQLIEEGANGYLLKNAEPDEINLAMHTVTETDYYFNDLVSSAMLRNMMQKTKIASRVKVGVKLTDKEEEVLRMICAERTAAEIGKEIFLSQRTVEGVRSLLLEKTGARNTAGLVLYAIKNGIYNG